MGKLIDLKIILYICLLAICITSCTNKYQIEKTNALDTYSLKQNNVERTFILHLPIEYDKSKKYSLCFIFHGGNGNAKLMVDKKYTQKANNLDFIMVYPNGIDGKWDFKGKKDGLLNDIEFISTLIDYMKLEYSIDVNRVYAGGVSMGGVMAYSLALNIPEKISAVTAVSSTATSLNSVPDFKPVSILHIHAKNDLVIPYDKVGYGAVYTINKWREINKSEISSQVFLDKNGIYGEMWSSTKTGKITSLISNEVGGHGALPYTVDFTFDFFYNNPARENRISFDIGSVKDSYIVNNEIMINLELDNFNNLKEIIYLIDGKKVESISDKPGIFKWVPTNEGRYKLSSYAILDNGTKIHSAISLDLLVVRPYNVGKYDVKASSIENRFLQASNISDGNLSTRWASKYSDNQEIVMDLNKPKEISGLSIIWEDAYAESYLISFSNDGITWITKRVNKEDNSPDFINFETIKCRYIKLRGNKRATSWGYSIYEILIH